MFLYLPSNWSLAYSGSDAEDFDLHDYLKATTAAWRIPIQLVREDSAISYPDRASVMWRIGLALYAKAGGVPWKLADANPESAFIGLSYSIRSSGNTGSRFVTCCSQVFDADGAGLEFVAYDANDAQVIRKNPYLSRNEMFRVMARSLDVYRRRHSGRIPKRITVHKTSEFKSEEIEGCLEAFNSCESVDLIQVIENVAWRGVRLERDQATQKGVPAAFPVARGTLIGLGPYECLLWIHGDVQGISERGSYFQGKKSTPRPICLVRHAGHGSWDETARSALALSKMNWNNDALYDPIPVTLSYAQVLARVVKRMPKMGTEPYEARFFI